MARSHDSSDSAGGASFTPWLREQLRNHSNVALQSFEKLCERCDEDFLVVRLAMLHHSFRPIDARLDGQLNLAKAKKIAKRAEALLDDIAGLKRDPVVEFLRKLGQFGRDDFLSGQFFTDGFRFDGLKQLPELFRRFGPHRRNPEHDELMAEIEEHIRQSFGQPRNALLAHVLDAVLPQDPVHSEDALKTASFRRRNTRKR